MIGAAPSRRGSRLRKRVLLLDHDDTAVMSTAQIHYPAHVTSVRALRPDREPCTLAEWFERCHDPGVSKYLASLFSPSQLEEEHNIWTREVRKRGPADFFEGIPQLLAEFRSRGGEVVVISHSQTATIMADYGRLPETTRPHLVYGWHPDPARKKPAPWPAQQALAALGRTPDEAVMLDDLSPGISMANAAGIEAVGAGWGHQVPSIEADMRANCAHYFSRVDAFAAWLLQSVEETAVPPHCEGDAATASRL